MYKSKEDLNTRLQEHYEAAKKLAKHEVFGVFLQGSQNYIDDKFLESSDVDSRALLLPNKRDIILGRNSSGETLIVGGEHVQFPTRSFIPSRESFKCLFFCLKLGN